MLKQVINNKKIESHSVKFKSSNEDLVELYLFYTQFNSDGHDCDFADFFQHTLHAFWTHHPFPRIFLGFSEARRYSRYMEADHCILKVIVPEDGIEAIGAELILQNKFLNNDYVEGCYVFENGKTLYHENPLFKKGI